LFNRAKDILRLIFPEVGPGLENQGAVIVSVVRRGEWDAIRDFTSSSSLFRYQVYSVVFRQVYVAQDSYKGDFCLD